MGVFFDLCPQSHRSTAQFTVQAICAAGLPVRWEQRGRARETNRIAPISAVWWLWDVSTPTYLPKLTEKSELNPQSSSHAMPWMANSPLSIKGRLEFQQGGGVSCLCVKSTAVALSVAGRETQMQCMTLLT